jgi:hypothetical protein
MSLTQNMANASIQLYLKRQNELLTEQTELLKQVVNLLKDS